MYVSSSKPSAVSAVGGLFGNVSQAAIHRGAARFSPKEAAEAGVYRRRKMEPLYPVSATGLTHRNRATRANRVENRAALPSTTKKKVSVLVRATSIPKREVQQQSTDMRSHGSITQPSRSIPYSRIPRRNPKILLKPLSSEKKEEKTTARRLSKIPVLKANWKQPAKVCNLPVPVSPADKRKKESKPVVQKTSQRPLLEEGSQAIVKGAATNVVTKEVGGAGDLSRISQQKAVDGEDTFAQIIQSVSNESKILARSKIAMIVEKAKRADPKTKISEMPQLTNAGCSKRNTTGTYTVKPIQRPAGSRIPLRTEIATMTTRNSIRIEGVNAVSAKETVTSSAYTSDNEQLVAQVVQRTISAMKYMKESSVRGDAYPKPKGLNAYVRIYPFILLVAILSMVCFKWYSPRTGSAYC